MATAREVYTVLGNETLWQTAQRCHQLLRQANIPYAVAGGVAVCVYGYQRNTVDLDLLIRPADQPAVRALLEQAGFAWSDERHEFSTPAGVVVQLLLTGQPAGPGQQIKLPDPGAAEVVVEQEGLAVLSLARLIEAKLACGLGNLRRTHKDFADVVELIAIHRLDSSFARFLAPSIRKEFMELVRHAAG